MQDNWDWTNNQYKYIDTFHFLQGLAPICESYPEMTDMERFEMLAEDEEYENGEKTPTADKFLQHFCEYSRILQEVRFS